MRFLFKLAFLLIIGFIVLAMFNPSPDGNGEKSGNFAAFDALLAARNTIADLGGFCQRNPGTCETGREIFSTLGEKAHDGARIAYEFLDARFGDAPETDSAPDNEVTTGAVPPAHTGDNHGEND